MFRAGKDISDTLISIVPKIRNLPDVWNDLDLDVCNDLDFDFY